MKNILLSSAAIALLAGAASAEVTWSGDAEIGYNDDFEDGAYWDAGLTIGLSQELNNGWTVTGSLDIDLDDDDDDDDGDGMGTTFSLGDIDTTDWVLTLSNDMFSLSFGDVDTAYAAFSGVGAVYDNDLFAPNDEAADYDDGAAGFLVSAEYGQFDAAVSYVVVDQDSSYTGSEVIGNGTNGDVEHAQVYLGADFDMFTAGLFYAEDVAYDATGVNAFYDAMIDAGATDADLDDDIFKETNGISGAQDLTVLTLGAALAGADFTFSYADADDVSAYGLEVSYPIGPVTLGAYYASYDFDTPAGFSAPEDDAYGVSVDYVDGPITVAAYYEEVLGEEEYAIEGAYDFGMGLVVTAGYIDGDDNDDDDFASYIVAEYDLGGGASFLASYADANNDAAEHTDDIDTGVSGYELYSGATMALSFEF